MEASGMKASNNQWNIIQHADELIAAKECAQLLRTQIAILCEQQASVSLFVSGGKSPAQVFDYLSEADLPWTKINIHLVDERWAPDHPSDLNQTLVRQHLLKHTAANANFQPLLITSDIKTNIEECNRITSTMEIPDIVLLGMGLDGHTASLFPDASDYDNAMNSNAHYVTVHPGSAPYMRISMSYHWLRMARQIILFIPGAEKWKAFQHFLLECQDKSPLQKLPSDAANPATVIVTEGYTQ